MFGPERRDDQVVPALVATRPALPTDFLAGADPGRPGCVSRVSGSTPPAESKKIHAKDSRTSRAVGCPSRCPSCAPRHSTICECRPPWREDFGPDWTRFPIARLHYTKTIGLWTLHWRDRNQKYHRYEPLDPSPQVQRAPDTREAVCQRARAGSRKP